MTDETPVANLKPIDISEDPAAVKEYFMKLDRRLLSPTRAPSSVPSISLKRPPGYGDVTLNPERQLRLEELPAEDRAGSADAVLGSFDRFRVEFFGE